MHPLPYVLTNVNRFLFTYVIDIFITFVNEMDTIMNDRLAQFLAAENITQAAFADKINVARASVSHILAGRNKPGYDFFASLVRNYPSLNIEWLLTGKGRMYKSQQSDGQFHDLFSTMQVESAPQEQETPVPMERQTAQAGAADMSAAVPETDARQRHAIRIIVFYDDNTFEEFGK